MSIESVSSMNQLTDWIESGKGRFLEELFDLLRIPSVSADPKFTEDVFRAAEWLHEKLELAGADLVEVIPTQGYPIVYAEKIIDPKALTVLVYGHYDVQPADPYELWNTPPFEPTVREGKIYARGACDDKGQLYMHVKALEGMIATGNLPCNIKFMLEGEEEVGSSHLGDFVRDNKDRLACDVVMVSDTAMVSNEVPSITTGLRGMSYVEVEVVGPNRDLHSGVYGGAVANPINVLSDMIASLVGPEGRITIPGFYDEVADVPNADRDAMASVPFDEEAYKRDLGVKSLDGEEGFTALERTCIRPSLDVNGIWGGYIGEGAKTVLPSKAHAKISMRLVPNQRSEAITKLFSEHFVAMAPPGVKVTVTPHHGGEAAVVPTDFPAFRAASRAMEQTFGKVPIPLRSGGSIPIVAMFEEVLGVKTILMGFGLDSDAIHSPNEHFGIFNYYRGIETIPWFYRFLVEETGA